MPRETYRPECLRQAVQLACDNVADGGRPFGAVVVRDGVVVGSGVNAVHRSHDPTAHAEIEAIRDAARSLGPDLSGCELYASGEPCIMCRAAATLAGIRTVYTSYTREDAVRFGLVTPGSLLTADGSAGGSGIELEHVSDPALPNPYKLWQEWSRSG